MTCPKCGSWQLRIADSRPADFTVNRKRECLDCGHRFSTVEITLKEYEEVMAVMVQKRQLVDQAQAFLDSVRGIVDNIPDRFSRKKF